MKSTMDRSCFKQAFVFKGRSANEALELRLVDMLRQGTDPQGALALCPRASAKAALQARLLDRCGDAARNVRVATPRELELELLAGPEAESFFGRRMRLMAPFEVDLLMRDMETCGMDARRLHEMLKFFARGTTELADRDPRWLIDREERGTMQYLRECLAFSQGAHPAEVSNAAVRLAHDRPDLAAPFMADHVFAFDYQCANRASQLFMQMLARETFALAGDESAVVECEDPYPFPEGIGEFVDAHPKASVVRSDGGPAVVVGELRSTWLEEEAAAIAAKVRDALDSGIAADEIYVVAPGSAWAAELASEIRCADVPVALLEGAAVLRAPVNDRPPAALEAFAALSLVADPRDATAWRAWCGLGDHLACSAGFAQLEGVARRGGLSLPQVVEAVGQGKAPDVPDARKIAERWADGQGIIAALSGLSGEPLVSEARQQLRCLGIGVDAQVDALLNELGGRGSAAALVNAVRRRACAPCFDGTGVKIGPIEAAAGQRARLVIVTRCLNGIVPKRAYFDPAAMDERKRAHEQRRMRAMFRMLAMCAAGTIMCSISERALPEEAARLGLSVKRFRLQGGRRICVLPESAAAQMIRDAVEHV